MTLIKEFKDFENKIKIQGLFGDLPKFSLKFEDFCRVLRIFSKGVATMYSGTPGRQAICGSIKLRPCASTIVVSWIYLHGKRHNCHKQARAVLCAFNQNITVAFGCCL